MYLRTPKKYQRSRRNSLISWRRVFFWLFISALIFGGYVLYDNRETVVPMVNGGVETLMSEGNQMVATITAPTPSPTENPVNLINRADMSWLSGQVEEAISEYEEAIELVPNDVTTHYNLTRGYIVEGRYAEAVDMAERTVTADPFSSDAWAIRALALTRNGDDGAALASGLQALALDPENPRAHAFLTEVYLGLEQFGRAEESAARAIELDPNNPESYYARAQVEQLVNFDRPAAREDFATAYELAPYMTDAAIEMAWVDAALQDYDSAINTLNVVKDANPDNTAMLYALGFMYYAGLGDPNQAADELARCVTVDTNSQNCHYYYGRVLIALEQYNDAADVLGRAVELTTLSDVPNPRFHYWAGEAQIYLGNCPAALNYLRPGYDIALAQQNDDLISALQTSIRDCTAFSDSPQTIPNIDDDTATPEITPTIPPDA